MKGKIDRIVVAIDFYCRMKSSRTLINTLHCLRDTAIIPLHLTYSPHFTCPKHQPWHQAFTSNVFVDPLSTIIAPPHHVLHNNLTLLPPLTFKLPITHHNARIPRHNQAQILQIPRPALHTLHHQPCALQLQPTTLPRGPHLLLLPAPSKPPQPLHPPRPPGPGPIPVPPPPILQRLAPPDIKPRRRLPASVELFLAPGVAQLAASVQQQQCKSGLVPGAAESACRVWGGGEERDGAAGGGWG